MLPRVTGLDLVNCIGGLLALAGFYLCQELCVPERVAHTQLIACCLDCSASFVNVPCEAVTVALWWQSGTRQRWCLQQLVTALSTLPLGGEESADYDVLQGGARWHAHLGFVPSQVELIAAAVG